METTAKASLVYEPVDASQQKSARLPHDVAALHLGIKVCKNISEQIILNFMIFSVC